MQLELKLKLN